MSVAGVFSSIGKAVGTGFNAGVGRGFKIGGLGTMATTAGIGAAAGLGLSASSDNSADPVTSAGIGAAAGATALPMAGFAAGAFGSTAVGAAKLAPGVMSGVGSAAVGASPFVAAFGAKAANKVGSGIWNVGKRMINWDEAAEGFGKVKFTDPISGARAGWNNNKGIKKFTNGAAGAIMNGVTMMGGVAVAEGMKKAFGTVQTAKMGQMVGTDSMTPRVPSYSNNAGASGDLVFALNANRRG